MKSPRNRPKGGKRKEEPKQWTMICYDGHNFLAPDGTRIMTDWGDCEAAIKLLNAMNKSLDDARSASRKGAVKK